MNMTENKIPKKTNLIPWIIFLIFFVIPGYFLFQFAAETGTKRVEGAMKGKLSAVRGAFQAYYKDTGRFPDDLEALTAEHKYLNVVPMAWTGAESMNARPPHKPTNEVVYYSSHTGYTDTGKWAYITAGPGKRNFFVDCTHTDVKGIAVWSQF